MKKYLNRIFTIMLACMMVLMIQVPVHAAATCMQVSGTTSYSTTVGDLLEIPMKSIFKDSSNHSATYTLVSPTDNDWIKLADGTNGGTSLYFTASASGTQNVSVRAKCSSGSTATANITVSVKAASGGLSAQYNYNQTPAKSVTVYVTLSSDGIPLVGNDSNKTVLSHLKVTVPYFSLENYDLQDFNRYQTDSNGNYVGDMTSPIERPTALHLYIYLLERYYFGLPESQCCKGNQNLDTNADFVVKNMEGKKAYTNDKSGLYITGSATSMYMSNFWGHDENLMYYRNHVYPLQRAGWGSTADYILLSNNDTMDVAMFTNWNFYTHGAFLCFGKSGSTSPVDEFTAKTGEKQTYSLLQFGTQEVSDGGREAFKAFSSGAKVRVYKESEMKKLNGTYATATKASGGNGNNWTYTFSEAGTYYLVAVDSNYGTSDACYAPATAKVVVSQGSGSEQSAIKITTQPSDYTGAVNDTATFQVAATGNNLSYQWQYSSDGTKWYSSGQTGNKTNTLKVGITTARAGQLYRCKITDGSGNTVYSNTATIKISQPTSTTLAITKQPSDYSGTVGTNASFTLAATGDGLKYQWYYSSNKGTNWYKSGQTGNTTNTISVPITSSRNGQMYRCTVTDSSGKAVTSNAVTLTVKEATSTTLKITSNPSDYSGSVGETASFTVKAEGSSLKYQWYFSTNKGSSWSKSSATGYNTATVSFEIKSYKYGQMYRCVVTDGSGKSVTSEAASLLEKQGSGTTDTLKIVTQPKSVTGAIVNNTYKFTVEAEGTGLTYQWYYSKDGKNWYKSGMTGSTTKTLSVTMTSARNGQMYRCTIKDSKGNEVTSNTVSISL